MMVSGRPISRDAFVHWASAIEPVIDDVGASFFEATTAIALADFAARRVDVAVIEVGLGGRLDATNIVHPIVSAVTSIGVEHTDYLGTSLDEIAIEKAGIAKRGVPFVIGERDEAVVATLIATATHRGANPIRVPVEERWEGPLGLAGSHQRRNAAVARRILQTLPPNLEPQRNLVEHAFSQARLPGRGDVRGKWVFDVAHNPAAIEALVDFIGRLPPRTPIHAVVCFLGDKDWVTALPMLRPVVDRIWVTQAPSAPAHRRWDPGQAAAAFGAGATVEVNFPRAMESAQEGAGRILVTGSFHTVGDALVRLPGFTPLG
jgi:dihydrofolate synthase/folylpolyglutamate synthase